MTDLYVAILAAGKGTRMNSDIPKVLHRINDKPLINFVLDTVNQLATCEVNLIVGHLADLVKEATSDYQVNYVLQAQQLGTGHALMMLSPKLQQKSGKLLVLCGDVPFTTKQTLNKLLQHHLEQQAHATVLTVKLEDAGNYGRIVRDEQGYLKKIVEAKDASVAELSIKEINSGIYIFDIPLLFEILKKINTKNAQKEYYLTDVIELLNKQQYKVSAYAIEDKYEVAGINTVEDLKNMERHYLRLN